MRNAFSFPLAFVPNYSGGRAYGAVRKSKRGVHLHAGVDLMAPVGTPVHAVADGVVLMKPMEFAKDCKPFSYAILVKHGFLTVLYGEINREDAATPGTVVQGQAIGTVARTGRGSMLHLEVYKGHYKKGGEIDPTPYLDQWRSSLPAAK